ncbi:MAG: cytochrome c, mono- and diheme variant family [Herminiimonas sp.]|jgi:ubiquinol-cytochrome c reductase cytochrome c subunit|nr:cytochrome c, mono- and diheme variant family [Herminiimonas sp.]
MNPFKKTGCAVLMALLGQSAIIAQASAQATTDARHGQELFMKRGCYLCHGTVGQGSNAGPHIAPDPVPYAAFTIFVRTPASQMPPFSDKVLSEPELRDIHAYLSSIPKPQAADSIKLLPKAELK